MKIIQEISSMNISRMILMRFQLGSTPVAKSTDNIKMFPMSLLWL